MPDWTKNRVYFVCANEKEADEVLARLEGKDDEGRPAPFTFDSFIPMPESLNITSGAQTRTGMEFLKKYPNGLVPEGCCDVRPSERALELGSQALENIRRHGYPTWFEWRRAHWGTKWDACETTIRRADDARIELSFNTAWNMPYGIAEEMKKVFGDKLVAWIYADDRDRELPEVFSRHRELDVFAEDLVSEVWQEYEFGRDEEDDDEEEDGEA